MQYWDRRTLVLVFCVSLAFLLVVHLFLFTYYTDDSLEYTTGAAASADAMTFVHMHERTGTLLQAGTYRESITRLRADFPSDPPLVWRSGVGVDCRALFRGEKEEQLSAFEYMENKMQQVDSIDSPDWFRYNDNNDECERFLNDRKYVRWSASAEEDAFPMAFTIVMYKDVAQFERLLRAVFRPQNTICVHVDRNASESIFRIVQQIAQCLNSRVGTHKPSVFVPERERVRVEHSKFSVLEAELVCLRALRNAGRRWKYVINLTGQEFPLRTNLELVRILRSLNGANLVAADPVHNRDRILRPDLVPHGLYVYKGSLHVAVTFEFVQFALSDRRALELLEFLRLHTRVPDEFFFSTLNHNPRVLPAPGAYTGHPQTGHNYPFLVRFKNWGRFPCKSGLFMRGICIWGIEDLPLLATRFEFVANKFLAHFQPLALDCLEEWFWNRTAEDYLFGQFRADFLATDSIMNKAELVGTKRSYSFRQRDPLFSLYDWFTLEMRNSTKSIMRLSLSRINLSFYSSLDVTRNHIV